MRFLKSLPIVLALVALGGAAVAQPSLAPGLPYTPTTQTLDFRLPGGSEFYEWDLPASAAAGYVVLVEPGTPPALYHDPAFWSDVFVWSWTTYGHVPDPNADEPAMKVWMISDAAGGPGGGITNADLHIKFPGLSTSMIVARPTTVFVPEVEATEGYTYVVGTEPLTWTYKLADYFLPYDVPTLGQWGLIALTLSLLAVGVFVLYRRRSMA